MFGNHQPHLSQPMNGGEQHKFLFGNGFGASVVRGPYTYGGPGLWELAVLGLDGHITYETPLTSDVIGYLSDDEVATTLDAVAALTPEPIAEAKAEKVQAERAERIAELRRELAELEAEVSA